MTAKIYRLEVRRMPEAGDQFIRRLDELLDASELSEEDYQQFYKEHVERQVAKAVEWKAARIRELEGYIAALRDEREHINARIRLHENAIAAIKRSIRWDFAQAGLEHPRHGA